MSDSKRDLKIKMGAISKRETFEKLRVILNAVLFQCLWFSVMVFEQRYFEVFLGALMVQFFYQWYVVKVKVVFMMPLVVFVLGVCIDISYTAMGLFNFTDETINSNVTDIRLFSIPLWLVVMWLGFVLTLQHSLQWLIQRRYMCILVFAISGAVSYIAGRRFGMIGFEDVVGLYLIFSWALVGWVTSLNMTKKQP